MAEHSFQDSYVAEILTAVERAHNERAARHLEVYRPHLVVDVGEAITERLLTHSDLYEFVRAAYEWVETEEAVAIAGQYLTEHPDAPTDEAFAHALARFAEMESD